MKTMLKNMLFIALFISIYALHAQNIDDKKIPLSLAARNTQIIDPAMINIKLIALQEKTWWIADRIKITAQDEEQKALIEIVQQNAIEMKNILMEDLKKRLCEPNQNAIEKENISQMPASKE
jgi:hypothetical protein